MEATVALNVDNTTRKMSLASEHASEWIAGIELELKALEHRETLNLVSGPKM